MTHNKSCSQFASQLAGRLRQEELWYFDIHQHRKVVIAFAAKVLSCRTILNLPGIGHQILQAELQLSIWPGWAQAIRRTNSMLNIATVWVNPSAVMKRAFSWLMHIKRQWLPCHVCGLHISSDSAQVDMLVQYFSICLNCLCLGVHAKQPAGPCGTLVVLQRGYIPAFPNHALALTAEAVSSFVMMGLQQDWETPGIQVHCKMLPYLIQIPDNAKIYLTLHRCQLQNSINLTKNQAWYQEK